MMYDVIKNFHHQFSCHPVIENAVHFKKSENIIIAGMGGSQLASELIKTLDTKLNFILHKDYGLPNLPVAALKKYLIIATSYSGNTEETIASFEAARKLKLPLLALSTGGKLLAMAKKYEVPYIQLPNAGIQPRSALGYSFKALLAATQQTRLLREAGELARSLDPSHYEASGRALARKLKNFVPVVYASARNFGLAYNWKIKLNETGKIPAFCNAVPELNHNEMNAFDVAPGTKALCKAFTFIFLQDKHDNPRIAKRMSILQKLYEKRGLAVHTVPVIGKNMLHALFSSVLLADFVSYYSARQYRVDPNEVPMVEEFKRLI